MYTLRQLLPRSFNKKILLVFSIATFIPILLLTYITSGYISNSIEEEVKSNLIKSTKSYALLTFDKITSLSYELKKISLSIDDSIPVDLVSNFDAIQLESLPAVEDSNSLSKPRLSIHKSDVDTNYLLTIERVHYSQSGDKYVLTASFNDISVFGDQTTNPFNEPVCIFTARKINLFCNESITSIEGAKELASSLIDSNKRIIEKSYAGKDYILASWELFLPTHFQSEPWHFVIMKPSSLALSTIKNANKFILPVILLFFLLIAYVLHRIILTLFKPLHEIHAATDLLSKGQYNISLDVKSNDEFQVLGDAFQDMSHNIGHTIQKERVFKKFQQEVLSDLDINAALKSSLDELLKLFNCHSLTIALCDPINNESFICHSIISAKSESIKMTYSVAAFDINASRSPLSQAEYSNYLQPMSSFDTCSVHYFYKIETTLGNIGYILLGTTDVQSIPGFDLSYIDEFLELIHIIYSAHQQRIKLDQLANFDDLTRLPNRYNLLSYITRHWATFKNNFALIYIDLDNFKNVNDLSGHKTGDEVLIEAASRLRSCIDGHALLARLSGDEFCILIENVSSEEFVVDVAQNIITRFKLPIVVSDMPFYISCSIGIAIGPKHGDNPDSLIENADLAMYKAKQEGKSTFAIFDNEIQKERTYRLSLEHHIHSALEDGELSIKFQPKIDLFSGKLVSAESLIRWNQKDIGFVNTELFISLAEESGLINEIGRWILRKSCFQFMDWHAKGIEMRSIAVNVSARQLASKDFINIVSSVLEETKIPPSSLDLEITESAFINDESFLTDELTRLHSLGVQISIDDFGKEYSSLSYLKKIPFDNLKIDREFIMELDTDIRDEHIVNVIINIGHTLGKKIIAEGIETAPQRDILVKLGCDIGQGYLYSRPLSDIEFLEFATAYSNDVTALTPNKTLLAS